jgi:homoserine dehydrogenase
LAPLKIGIAGLGHVGCGLIELVERQHNLRLPGEVQITGVSARSQSRNRPVDISPYRWFDDAATLAEDPDVDVFVELMGGSDGPAKFAVETALKAGKHVVTANKALIAKHGMALARLAEEKQVDLLFEAAVAGGIPVVRVLRDSLAGTEVKRITGILNGTCNYLTTVMLEQGREYDDVLAEAQRLGYAEADPTLDVSGMDAAHKAAILSAIAFSADLDFSKVSVSGIDKVSLLDLRLADRLGYRIKLIAEGVLTDEGVVCRVEPLVLPATPSAGARQWQPEHRSHRGRPGRSDHAHRSWRRCRPDRERGDGRCREDVPPSYPPGLWPRRPPYWADRFVQGAPTEVAPFFLRVYLPDQPGALAALTEALAKEGVSVDKLLQESG